MQLHTRASWSAREDRRITLLWLGLFLAIVLFGFGSDLTNYLHEKPAVPKVVHVHAAITTVWLAILTVQVLLVEVENVKLHRKLGWFAAGWAALLIVFAAWGELSWEATNLHTPGDTPAFLSISMGGLLSFSVLIAWGILLRKNVAAHRRVVLLANLSIASAGFLRLIQFFAQIPASPVRQYLYFYTATIFISLLMFLWDWKKNRLMKQFVLGIAFVVAVQMVSIVLFQYPGWKNFAGNLVAAWGRFAL
jgi:hypothetical protein